MNLHDLSVESSWQAETMPVDLEKTSQSGGNGGSPFDDRDMLGLHRQWTTSVTKVFMRSGQRVDKVGFTYNNGMSVEHGGSGGSYSEMVVPYSDYINSVTRCIGQHNGSGRITYLRFETRRRHVLEGGNAGSGACYSYSYDDRSVIGMFGRSGEELDAIGFYTRAVEDHSGWNHGEPNGGTDQNCAKSNGSVLSDKNCVSSYPVACRRASDGDWQVVSSPTQWGFGRVPCAWNLGSGYSFDAPRTQREAEQLQEAMGSHAVVWINYSDGVSEGAWRFGPR